MRFGGNCSGSGLIPKNFSEYIVVPCAHEGVICIGATSADETLASYSNYSSKKDAAYRTRADLNAPGTAIYSTWPRSKGRSYNTISGTSMATPYAAGVAAVLKALEPSLKQEDIKALLLAGQAKPADVITKSETGRLDLYSTLVAFANQKSLSSAPPSFTPEKKPVEPPAQDAESSSSSPGQLFKAVCSSN